MFGFFKSKEEKEQAKADKEVAKMQKEASASAKINDATLKREAAERAREFQNELDNKKRVYKAEAALRSRDENARASLAIAVNSLQKEQAKKYPNPVDIQRSRQRVKNYFFEVVTINRAQHALEECKLNNQWDRGMNDLSKTFKLMNEVKTGSGPLKKLIFFYRHKRVEGMGDEVFSQVNDYFGPKAKPLPENMIKEIESKNPVDLMISDKLFDVLVDAASSSIDPSEVVDSCINNPNIVETPLDDVINYTDEANRKAAENGEPPIIEEMNNTELKSDEDLDKLLQF